MQTALEQDDIDVAQVEDIADQVTGATYSIRRQPISTSPSAMPPTTWFHEALRQFRAIERLRAGWDSQGSAPPNRETIRSGARLLHALAVSGTDVPRPHIHPTRSGGVQFSWESGPRYFEIDVLDPRTAQYYFVDNDAHVETEGELRVGDSVAQVLRLVHTVERSP